MNRSSSLRKITYPHKFINDPINRSDGAIEYVVDGDPFGGRSWREAYLREWFRCHIHYRTFRVGTGNHSEGRQWCAVLQFLASELESDNVLDRNVTSDLERQFQLGQSQKRGTEQPMLIDIAEIVKNPEACIVGMAGRHLVGLYVRDELLRSGLHIPNLSETTSLSRLPLLATFKEQVSIPKDRELDGLRVWRRVLSGVPNNQLEGQVVEDGSQFSDNVSDQERPVRVGLDLHPHDPAPPSVYLGIRSIRTSWEIHEPTEFRIEAIEISLCPIEPRGEIDHGGIGR